MVPQYRRLGFMQQLVVLTFALVGPIILVTLVIQSLSPATFDLEPSAFLTDIFKIWLGAIIGISVGIFRDLPAQTEKPAPSTPPSS